MIVCFAKVTYEEKYKQHKYAKWRASWAILENIYYIDEINDDYYDIYNFVKFVVFFQISKKITDSCTWGNEESIGFSHAYGLIIVKDKYFIKIECPQQRWVDNG